MAVRLIDAIELQRRMCALCNQDYSDEPCEPSDCVFIRAINEMPTLTPPNEWVSRVQELDELYTKLQTVTGFTAEQLLEMFKAGYTLEKPDYSKLFEEMERLAETTPPNEPLTCDGCDMQGKEVTPCASCIRDPRVCDYYTRRPPERQ